MSTRPPARRRPKPGSFEAWAVAHRVRCFKALWRLRKAHSELRWLQGDAIRPETWAALQRVLAQHESPSAPHHD